MTEVERPNSFVHAPEISFLGNRCYLHSTDFYEELLRGAHAMGIDPDREIELKFRRVITRQPEFHYTQSAKYLAPESPAIFSFRATGVLWHGVILERDASVVLRKPYDETLIWNCAVQKGHVIRLDKDPGLQPIETVTALGVLLTRRLFPEPDDRKWYLARIRLTRPLTAQDVRMLRIELIGNVGSAMTRSSITGNGHLVGYVEYMLGPAC